MIKVPPRVPQHAGGLAHDLTVKGGLSWAPFSLSRTLPQSKPRRT